MKLAEEKARLQVEIEKEAAEAKKVAEQKAKEAEERARLEAEIEGKAAAEKEAKQLVEQKAKEAEEKAQLQAETEKKADEAKQLAEQKAKEAKERARLQAEVEEEAKKLVEQKAADLNLAFESESKVFAAMMAEEEAVSFLWCFCLSPVFTLVSQLSSTLFSEIGFPAWFWKYGRA